MTLLLVLLETAVSNNCEAECGRYPQKETHSAGRLQALKVGMGSIGIQIQLSTVGIYFLLGISLHIFKAANSVLGILYFC